MLRFFFLLCIIGSALQGCQKTKIPKDVPPCIKQKLKQLKKSSCSFEGKTKMLEYRFQNQPVFVIYGNSCFMQYSTDVFDDACNVIGKIPLMHPTEAPVNGEDFSNAILVRTVWEKD